MVDYPLLPVRDAQALLRYWNLDSAELRNLDSYVSPKHRFYLRDDVEALNPELAKGSNPGSVESSSEESGEPNAAEPSVEKSSVEDSGEGNVRPLREPRKNLANN